MVLKHCIEAFFALTCSDGNDNIAVCRAGHCFVGFVDASCNFLAEGEGQDGYVVILTEGLGGLGYLRGGQLGELR